MPPAPRAPTPAPVLGALRRLLVGALLVLPALGCDETTETPPVVLPDTDRGVVELDLGLDGAPTPDATPGDLGLPDGPIVDLPSCLDPCDDGDPLTSGDRCVDGACVGEPLPPMLALVGDAPPLGADSPRAGEVLTLTVDGEALALTPTGARAPRALYSSDGGVWAARPLDAVDATTLARWDGAAFAPRTHRAPLAPAARVVALPGDAAVIIGRGGLCSHVAADGAVTPLGEGAADAAAFVGHVDGDWIARPLGATPGEAWPIEGIDGISEVIADATDATDAIRVIAGHGFVRTPDAVWAIDVAGRRTARVEVETLPAHASPDGRYAVVAAGDAVVDLGAWPPAVIRVERPWTAALAFDDALVTLDPDGPLWHVDLTLDGPDALTALGPAGPGARLWRVGDAAVVGDADGWRHIAPDRTLTPLPALAAELVGVAAGRAWFAEPGRIAALALDTLAVAALDDATIGPALGLDGATALVRAAEPAPLTLIRRGPDGDEALADVWVPDPAPGAPRGVDGAPIGVLAAGDVVAYLPSADGHVTAIDLAADTGPVEIARLNRRANWLDARISADGRWVVWRAGDALVGTLRGARTDGRHFPDGVPLWQSRAYPALVAPSGDRLTVAVEPGPTTGIPVVELDSEDPDDALFVRIDGQGTLPLAWVDDATFVTAHCFEDGCAAWGLGTVTVDAAGFQLRALVGGDARVRRPVWGRTAMVALGDLWFVRDDRLTAGVQRVALDGSGGWVEVASAARGAALRLVGPVERGLLFELGAGRAWYGARTGDAFELALPVAEGLSRFGPTGAGRPPIVMTASAPGLGCGDCGAWRLDRVGAPLRLGADYDGPLRPAAFSPDGQTVIHHGLAPRGHLELQITPAHADQRADGPRDPAADVRFVGWLSE